MASYKVTSDRIVGMNRGETVNDADLDGVNVTALVSGGHLEIINVKTIKQDTKEMDK